MKPRMKKSGSTVFGVRIGLRGGIISELWMNREGRGRYKCWGTYCQAFNRCCLKAVSVEQVSKERKGIKAIEM